MPKKNNHMHKTIFTRFGNLPTSTKLQGFHYHKKKNTSAVVQCFNLSKTTTTNPNYKSRVFYLLRIRFTTLRLGPVSPSLRSMD